MSTSAPECLYEMLEAVQQYVETPRLGVSDEAVDSGGENIP